MKINIRRPLPWYNTGVFDRWYIERFGFENIPDEDMGFWQRLPLRITDAYHSAILHPINKFNEWRGRKVHIEIENFDTWSMDHTLSMIVVPMLEQLRDTKHGAPDVSNDDVPMELSHVEHAKSDGSVDEFWFDRWEYVLAEMIWAHKQVASDDYQYDEKIQARIDNGLRLFGKYYRGLWD